MRIRFNWRKKALFLCLLICALGERSEAMSGAAERANELSGNGSVGNSKRAAVGHGSDSSDGSLLLHLTDIKRQEFWDEELKLKFTITYRGGTPSGMTIFNCEDGGVLTTDFVTEYFPFPPDIIDEVEKKGESCFCFDVDSVVFTFDLRKNLQSERVGVLMQSFSLDDGHRAEIGYTSDRIPCCVIWYFDDAKVFDRDISPEAQKVISDGGSVAIFFESEGGIVRQVVLGIYPNSTVEAADA